MDSQVLCSIPRNLDGLSPCTHEEADTRLLLHAADCAQHGHKKIMLRTVDTDVVVLYQLPSLKIWPSTKCGYHLVWVNHDDTSQFKN